MLSIIRTSRLMVIAILPCPFTLTLGLSSLRHFLIVTRLRIQDTSLSEAGLSALDLLLRNDGKLRLYLYLEKRNVINAYIRISDSHTVYHSIRASLNSF